MSTKNQWFNHELNSRWQHQSGYQMEMKICGHSSEEDSLLKTDFPPFSLEKVRLYFRLTNMLTSLLHPVTNEEYINQFFFVNPELIVSDKCIAAPGNKLAFTGFWDLSPVLAFLCSCPPNLWKRSLERKTPLSHCVFIRSWQFFFFNLYRPQTKFGAKYCFISVCQQWRIQDFPGGRGAPTPKVGLFWKLFAENYMKMKVFGPSKGARGMRSPMVNGQWSVILFTEGCGERGVW